MNAQIRSRHGRLLAVTVALLVTLAGCGGSDNKAAAMGKAVIPGGATLTVRDSAPEVCSQLTQSETVRALGEAITGWAQQASGDQAAGQLRAASVELGELAGDTGELAPAVTDASRALAHAADSKPSPRAVRRLASAMQRFGRQLESPCGFPLG